LESTTPRERIESWEEIAGECGMHPENLRTDPAESQAMLEQLVSLGYIEPPSEDAQKTSRETVNSNRLQLAQSLLDSGRSGEAIEVIEQLEDATRESSSVQLLLAFALIGHGDKQRARETLTKLLAAGCPEPRIHMMLGTIAFAD